MRRLRTALTLPQYLNDPRLRLPEQRQLGTAVRQLLDRHQQTGGATFSLFFGDLSGQQLYAVSVFPERSRRIPNQLLTADTLLRFVQGNQDILANLRYCIGIWTEAVVTEAIALGTEYNQIAVYDLSADRVIETGGTGVLVTNLVPEAERLPPLVRVVEEDLL